MSAQVPLFLLLATLVLIYPKYAAAAFGAILLYRHYSRHYSRRR